MTLLAELTVTALLIPLAITPPGTLAWSHVAMAPEAATQPAVVAPSPTPPAAAPVVVAPAPVAVAPAPVVVAPAPVASSTVVAPAGSTVVVSDGTASTTATAWPADVTTTTTATTTTTTTTTTTAAPTTAAAPAMTPKAAVRTLLRYDPYIAPRYRSGRNMMIGGGVALGVGTFTLLSTLSWLTFSRHELDDSADADERRRDARERDRWVPTARVVGIVAAAVALSGVVLLATGAVRRRRAIEEARGRVFMQAGPGGMQVRF